MPNVITYPGVAGVKSVTVTTSVGVTPAIIELVAGAGATPEPTGTLVLGDGTTGVTLTFPDCCCRADERPKAKGTDEVVVQLQDRRWRWKYGFPVDGHFNQEAGSGKLVPWSVRSPWQLAYRLLAALGELADPLDQIDLPPGLAQPGLPKAPGDRYVRAAGQYLGMGQNYALTQANPETRWASRPAALALADLAEYYGRLVVLDPIDNRVRLRQLGIGAALPAGGRLRTGFATQRDAIPANVRARGVADEYQLRLRLRAVAKDWDGRWVPVNDVSYAPLSVGQKMRCLVYGTGTFDPAAVYAVTLNGVPFTPGGPVASFADVATALAALVNASAHPAVAGKVAAAVDGGRLRLDGFEAGYEFELTTAGTDAPAPGTWAWTAACVRGPIRGDYLRQNAWLVEWPDPQPAGTVLGLTVTAGAAVTCAQVVLGTGSANDLADATDRLADQVFGVNATAVAGGRKLVVTGTVVGAAITVAASSTAGAAPTVTQVATPLAPGQGWERCPGPPFGAFARATDELNVEEAKRLANETVMTCYQVVCENPADPADKSIPVPDLGAIVNQFLLLLQPDCPEPVTPEPGLAEALDARTLQPFAATTYNGYAVRRPNRAFGSVCKHILAREGLLWRGGVYLTHNTAPRAPLPVTFSIADPEMQVVRFSQPLYRWLGTAAGTLGGAAVGAGPTWFTTQPAELVIEVGAVVLDPATLAPRATSWSVPVPGGFGPDQTRVFPDIRREVIAKYPDGSHEPDPAGPFVVLDQDAGTRALRYAKGVADTFQAPAGESVEFDGLVAVPLSGTVRQVRWRIGPGEPGLSTEASVNCETSRVVLPYPARRRAEGLPPHGDRVRQNLDSDLLSRTRERNAFGAAMGGGFGFKQGGR